MPWCFIDDYDENNFKDYDLSDLVLDQFYLNINVENSSGHEDVYLYTLNKECYQVIKIASPRSLVKIGMLCPAKFH